MSDTPRTDAQTANINAASGHRQWVPHELSCQLERELSAKTAELEATEHQRKGWMAEAQKQNAELEACKKDAERLDAIEANNWHVGRTPTHQWSVIAHTVSKIAQHPTLRGAIDAAMKEKQ